jgi:hypothetical protein
MDQLVHKRCISDDARVMAFELVLRRSDPPYQESLIALSLTVHAACGNLSKPRSREASGPNQEEIFGRWSVDRRIIRCHAP